TRLHLVGTPTAVTVPADPNALLILENNGPSGIQLKGPSNATRKIVFSDPGLVNQAGLFYDTFNPAAPIISLRAFNTSINLNTVNERVGIGTSSPAAFFSVGLNNYFRVEQSGNTSLMNQASLRLQQNNNNGSNFTGFRAPSTFNPNPTGLEIIYTLPDNAGSAGQVLTTNGPNPGPGQTPNTMTWTTIASGLGGSGTVNAVPKFGTATSLTSSGIVEDASANVGIGTTAPETKLHVFKGNAGAIPNYPDAAVILEDDSDLILQMLTPADRGSSIFFGHPPNGNDGSITFNAGALHDDKMVLRTGSAVVALDATDDNVGVGTTDPQSRLHVLSGFAGGGVTPHDDSVLTVEDDQDAYVHLLTPDDDISGILFGSPTSGVSGQRIRSSIKSVPDGDLILSVKEFPVQDATNLRIKDGGIGVKGPAPTGFGLSEECGSNSSIFGNNTVGHIEVGDLAGPQCSVYLYPTAFIYHPLCVASATTTGCGGALIVSHEVIDIGDQFFTKLTFDVEGVGNIGNSCEFNYHCLQVD
ncbi:MAG TPA: hypothetical protein VFX30_00075, partial [bacterium]|nr:hypothetical protein [bacterium]